MNRFAHLQGKWITFYAEDGSVRLCCPVPGARRVAGQVIGVGKETAIDGIPSCALTVKGRSGRQMTIDLVSHYVTEHATAKEACELADANTPPPTPPETWHFLCSDAHGTVWRNGAGHSFHSSIHQAPEKPTTTPNNGNLRQDERTRPTPRFKLPGRAGGAGSAPRSR